VCQLDRTSSGSGSLRDFYEDSNGHSILIKTEDFVTSWLTAKCTIELGEPRYLSRSPPMQLIQGDISHGVKRQGREADHSPPFSAEVKNCGATHLLYIFMARCFIN
jgi:hypothetical protein